MTAKVLLWWIEPPRQDAARRRSRRVDHLIAFGISAVIGLGIAEQSGPRKSVPIGGGFDFDLPSQAWQYGLWLLIFLVAGWLGSWSLSFGGRAQVTICEDGIQWIAGRVYNRFDPYARMQYCELARWDLGDGLVLRMTMQPARPGDPPAIHEVVIPRHIDADRVRGILHSAGVAIPGWNAD